ncbi:hypothetical protein LYZ77_11110, partial [Xanthomonas hortorum pv. vitians]|uniref:hypothetical protein n=1 Tax=Xanthomonas hortorum TaxID=56454 RepID=UPI001F444047
EDLPASLLALAQALSVTERQLHGSLLNMGVVSLICGALFRGSLAHRILLSRQTLLKALRSGCQSQS